MNQSMLKEVKRADTTVRPMHRGDIQVVAFERCPPWSTPEAMEERWNRYFQEQQEGLRTVGVVEREGLLLGYGSLNLRSEYPRFANIPEIQDVWIYEEFRGQGCATKLILWLEALAQKKGFGTVGLGVGLYADYGNAQKLYYHLGYCPDGNGITSKYKETVPGEPYTLDDDLILWLTKKL